ncbi:hypothetical protein D4R49_00650 [bacterium]|nr:MAG: hypothetical protein D4R49_00650 [bacterium]
MEKQVQMTKERFSEILKEYRYTGIQIEALWNSRPTDDLDEEAVRKTAEHFAAKKDLILSS